MLHLKDTAEPLYPGGTWSDQFHTSGSAQADGKLASPCSFCKSYVVDSPRLQTLTPG